MLRWLRTYILIPTCCGFGPGLSSPVSPNSLIPVSAVFQGKTNSHLSNVVASLFIHEDDRVQGRLQTSFINARPASALVKGTSAGQIHTDSDLKSTHLYTRIYIMASCIPSYGTSIVWLFCFHWLMPVFESHTDIIQYKTSVSQKDFQKQT